MSMSFDATIDPANEEASQAPERKRSLIVRVTKDPAGVASLIALLIGIVASVVHPHESWGVGVNSVGYALVGAAVFSFIYQFWANDALVRLISGTIKQAQRRAFREIRGQWERAISETTSSLDSRMNQLATLHRRHWPLCVYPEGSEPNPEFNHQLESDLQSASHYDFRGQSGKHLASRLLQARYPRLKVVRIIIEDATIPNVVNARIDEKRWSEPDRFAGVSDELIRTIVLDDLFDSLVGLYSARARFERIELAYASRPTDVRVEITDRIVYVSPYIRNRPPGNRYPEVFRYDPESIPAQVAALEYEREFALLSDGKLVFSPSTRRELLREHLSAKGWDISYEDFDLRYHRAEQALRALGTELSEPPDESGR